MDETDVILHPTKYYVRLTPKEPRKCITQLPTKAERKFTFSKAAFQLRQQLQQAAAEGQEGEPQPPS